MIQHKLSIITINFNNRDGLERTIKSVVEQTARHEIEYIVIDGGSTDGSVDVIQKYSDKIDYWVSEPDDGIYNAMNKGTFASKGLFCLFLNSGDILASPNVLNMIVPFLNDKVDLLTGNCYRIDSSGRKTEFLVPNFLTGSFFVYNSLPHQSTFIRRKMLIERPYDESLKIVSDWKFFVESHLYDKARYRKIVLDVAICEDEGISVIDQERNGLERSSVWAGINSKLLHPELCRIPYELQRVYAQIPYSYKLHKLLTKLSSIIVCIYCFFKMRKDNKSAELRYYKPIVVSHLFRK